MHVDQLTLNGVERFLKGDVVVLQIINTAIIYREKNEQKLEMVTAAVSDGFTYFKSIYLFLDGFPNRNLQNNIIKVKLVDNVIRKLANGAQIKSPLTTNADEFCLINNKINKRIGSPISFQEYMTNGRKNPKGSRKIFQKQNEDQQTQDDLFKQAQKLKKKVKQSKKIQQTKQQRQPSRQRKQNQFRETSNSNNNSRTNQTNTTNNNIKKPITNNKPIQKIQQPQKSPPKKTTQYNKNRQSSNSIKPEVKHHESDYQKIKQLFLGMQNFKILARLLFIWPIKVFTNKKGNQSQLINMQFGDQSGSIMCTVFGDNTHRYSKLALDMVYSITNATVTQSTFRGVTQLKLNFNDSTIVNLQENNQEQIKNIPKIQNFCISLKQLNESQKGRIHTVFCMVKQGQTVDFTSKVGNKMRKKTLKMFDFDHQLQSDLTLFNQHANQQYQTGMYALRGVQVDQYQGNKQFKANIVFMSRYLKNHSMNNRLKQFQQLTFTSIGSNQKTKKQSVSSFAILNQKCQEMKVGQNIWSEVICYFKAIRLGGNSKNIYLSCPHCRKKVIQQNLSQCQHCRKQIQKPKYRYILNVNLIDDHDNIWVNVYDDVGVFLLTLPSEKQFSADQFAQCSEQTLRKRIQQIRYKRIKTKIVSTKQQFNNQVRVKHKIVKILPIDFQYENNQLLQKIKSATGPV